MRRLGDWRRDGGAKRRVSAVDARWRAVPTRLPFVSCPRLGLTHALLALGLGLVLLAPFLRVRTIAWTGSVRLASSTCSEVEAIVLGRPLYLLPERKLRDIVDVSLEIVRRPPATLELRLEPRDSVALLEDGRAVLADGRLSRQPLPAGEQGLLRLEGVEAAERLPPQACAFLDAARRHQGQLRLVRARLEGEEWQVWLSGGSRVRLWAVDPVAQLQKLRVFEQGLRNAEMPPEIDLRFGAQVVTRENGRAIGG